MQGCPDKDGDGITDAEDKCGCIWCCRYVGCPIPDTDGDGINDENDKCPTVAGAPLPGMPDSGYRWRWRG